MTLSRRTAALAVAGAACLAAAGCGADDTGDPIPTGKAEAMEAQLDAVQAAVDDAQCEDVGPAVSELQTQIASLNDDGVGDDVQDALADGADNLRSLANETCEPEAPETTPETTPETITTPPPTETVPPPTETTPPPTETTPPPTTTTPVEPPPDQGGGGDQFDPGSGGGAIPPGQAKKQDGGG